MQVRCDQGTPGVSCFADRRDWLSLTNPVADVDRDRPKVGIEASQTMSVFHFEITAQSPMLSACDHPAAADRPNRTAKRRFEIHASMAPVSAPRCSEAAITLRIVSEHKRLLIKGGDDTMPVHIRQLVGRPAHHHPTHDPQHKGRPPNRQEPPTHPITQSPVMTPNRQEARPEILLRLASRCLNLAEVSRCNPETPIASTQKEPIADP